MVSYTGKGVPTHSWRSFGPALWRESAMRNSAPLRRPGRSSRALRGPSSSGLFTVMGTSVPRIHVRTEVPARIISSLTSASAS